MNLHSCELVFFRRDDESASPIDRGAALRHIFISKQENWFNQTPSDAHSDIVADDDSSSFFVWMFNKS